MRDADVILLSRDAAVAHAAGHITVKDVPEGTVSVAKNFKLVHTADIGTALTPVPPHRCRWPSTAVTEVMYPT